MTLTKTSNRVIAFLMCIIVMLTICVFQPMHQAQAAFVIDDWALISLIIAILAACGVAVDVTSDEGLQAIAQDFWDTASEFTKNIITIRKQGMEDLYDPHTNTYVESKVTIGTQEYIDIHSAVNQWASERIIDGKITKVGAQTTSYIKSTVYQNFSGTETGSTQTWGNYDRGLIELVYGVPYRTTWYSNSANLGYIDFNVIIEPKDSTTKTIKLEYEVFNTFTNTILYQNTFLKDIPNSNVVSPPKIVSYYGGLMLAIGHMSGTTKLQWFKTLGFETSINNSQIPDPILIISNPLELSYELVAKKNTWPYEIINRMHKLNIDNPTGTGEYELTLDLEEPVKNLNPANVLPSVFLPDISTPATPEEPDYSNPNLDRPTLKAKFISVFPFCLPWDLKQAFVLLAAEPEPPHFSVDILAPIRDKIGITGDTTISLDMADYPQVGEIIRWTVLISFSIGLILITRSLIKS